MPTIDELDAEIARREKIAELDAEIARREAQSVDNNDSFNKELKKVAQDQNPFQAGAISAGQGLAKLGRWAGFLDEETDIEKKAFAALEAESPISTLIGGVIGESAPFLIPGLGQGPLAAKLGGGLLARGGTAAGLGGAEAGIIASANNSDVETTASVGAGVAGTLELIAPKISKVVQKFVGSKPGQSLVSSNGEVSPILEKYLAEEGLTVDNLVDIAMLPDIAEEAAGSAAGRLSQTSAAKVAAKAIVLRQLKAGGRDDKLATLLAKGNKIVDDDAAKRAINQGFGEGTVQLAKTANKETQAEMNKALRLAFNITKQSRLAQTSRPSDFAGTALFDRVKSIKDKASSAVTELNNIARTQLKDAPFNDAPIRATINDIFEKLDIDDLNKGGLIPNPSFTGSQISGDKSSQRAISEVIRILKESKRNDALGGHLMKRQIDKLIDFSKMPSRGLGEDGEKALKSIRASFNDTLRKSSDDYARVNDVLHMSITGLEDLQKAVGKSVDLSMDGADRALGTSIRALFSNRQKRVELDNAFTQIDDIAAKLGGDFKTSYKDLSQFTREIEDVFGKTAATSFGGEISGTLKTARNQGALNTAIDKTIDVVSDKLNPKDQFQAFKAMREILERGAK